MHSYRLITFEILVMFIKFAQYVFTVVKLFAKQSCSSPEYFRGQCTCGMGLQFSFISKEEEVLLAKEFSL